jgi:hypothetical protein
MARQGDAAAAAAAQPFPATISGIYPLDKNLEFHIQVARKLSLVTQGEI